MFCTWEVDRVQDEALFETRYLHMYKKKILLRSILALALTSSMAQAAVSPEEAQRLKKDLMPLGGELKGNGKDIPDWTGGLTEKPAEYKRPEIGRAHV